MSLYATHKEVKFGVGDTIKVSQAVKEGDKQRSQTFEGMVIKIKGSGSGKSFTVRRLGSAQVGIERIFPLFSPVVESVVVVRPGTVGVKRSKLYYTRDKSKKEVDKIYSRTNKRTQAKEAAKKSAAKAVKKTTKKDNPKK
jgi:large subunit ribosomal protein L19